MDTIHETFWSEKFWMPSTRTWKDMENTREGLYSEIRHPECREILWVFPVAAVLLVVRYVAEQYILKPFAKNYGLKDKKVIYPEKNEELQKFFKEHRRPDHKQVMGLAKKLDWTPRRIERWFRIKRNLQKSSALQKFCEVGWRFGFYGAAFVYGIYVLHDETFTYDLSQTMDMNSWPHHHIKEEYLRYYTVEMAFYLSLLISLFNDVRRSDFWVHAIHHVLTIGLIFLSWTSNFVRLGMMVLVVHDVADMWVEIAKLCIYIKWHKTSDCFFGLFILSWIPSRVYFFPVHIVYPAAREYFNFYTSHGHFYAVLLTICFLSVLVVLHVIWTYYIVVHTMGILFPKNGGSTDERSASEESDVSSDTYSNGDLNSNAKLNGKKSD